MRLSLVPRLEQRVRLNLNQKLGLKHLLLLEQKLRHPDIPNVLKGLEGMKVAHQILQTRGAVGVLIGGLSEAVWDQRRKPEDLLTHKDVDVAVLDDDFELTEKFEGGIDWWMPKTGKVRMVSDISIVEGVEKKWYENGNGLVLSFGINKNFELKPGLYIPDPYWIEDMRVFEVDARVDYGRISVEIDEDVFQRFRMEIRKRVKSCLPRFIREEFEGYILTSWEGWGGVELVEFDLETIAEINRIRNKLEDSVHDELAQE